MPLMPWLMLAAREISGRMTDSDSVAIEFANVAAFARDSVVGGGMTDVSGGFRIMFSGRCDSVRVSYVGYEDVVISPVPENGLGHIYEPTARDKIGLQLDYNPDWLRQVSDSRTETESVGDRGVTSGRYVSHNRSKDFNVALNWSHSIDEHPFRICQKLYVGQNRCHLKFHLRQKVPRIENRKERRRLPPRQKTEIIC